MRVTLDSSVLIAATIARAGVCAAVLEDIVWRHELFLSEFILGEVERKLAGKFDFPPLNIARTMTTLRAAAVLVAPDAVTSDACRDPDDLQILGTAVAADAALLLTVDKDLLVMGSFAGIVIAKPGEFWRHATR